MHNWDLYKEPSPEEKKLKEEESRELARAFDACFTTPYGKIVLDYLKSVTLNRPSFMGHGSDGVNTALAMAFREGENNIVRDILRKTEKGRGNE